MGNVVPISIIAEVASARMPGEGVSEQWVFDVLTTLDVARERVALKRPEFTESWMKDSGFALEGLVQLTGAKSRWFQQQVPLLERGRLVKLCSALQMMTLEDIIEEAAKRSTLLAPEKTELLPGPGRRLGMDAILNVCVAVIVVLNILAMGISVDNSPDHLGWFAFEVVCVLVFVFEVCFKIRVNGRKQYFCGPTGSWNVMDCVVTALSILELSVSLVGILQDMNEDSVGNAVSGMARPIVTMRTFRVVRFVRLAKLLTAPMLRDLSSMLVGFVIGAPALVWVLAFFCFVLYVLALVFRITLGPSPDQDLIYRDGCGLPDDMVDFNHPTCKVHWMYGEEFFGSVATSMFTVFRFMLGDYSTRGGKSMIVALGQGYGLFFKAVFVLFMIIVIFGLFNIITAIFVDSTTMGLKHTDTKRKYAKQFERKFVTSKLRDLLQRVWHLHSARKGGSENFDDVSDFSIEEEEVTQILMDPVVMSTMADLDVDIDHTAGLFDAFSARSEGKVNMLEFVQVIMKLRGEPHKTDIIHCVASIRNLQDKFDQLVLMLTPSLERKSVRLNTGGRTSMDAPLLSEQHVLQSDDAWQHSCGSGVRRTRTSFVRGC